MTSSSIASGEEEAQIETRQFEAATEYACSLMGHLRF